MTYHHTGKFTLGRYANSYRYIVKDGVLVVEMAVVDGQHHVLVDVQDLQVILNLSESMLGKKTILLDGNLQAELYDLDYRFVPTWTYDPTIGVQATLWPSVSKIRSGSLGLARRILGLTSRKEKIQYRNGNNLDLRRSNLSVKSSFTEAEKASTTRISWSWQMKGPDPSLSNFTIVESHGGVQHPSLNPYDIVEYAGTRFVRMFAKGGEEFFFDHKDLQRILCVDNAFPTWSVSTPTAGSEAGYVFSTIKNRKVTLHTYLTGREAKMSDGKTVDHINWNKWDNRSANLQVVSMREQNGNRAPRTAVKGSARGAIPKSEYGPDICYDPPRHDRQNDERFMVSVPLFRLPLSLQTIAQPNHKKKAKDPLARTIRLASPRDSNLSEKQKLEIAQAWREALVDGSLFAPDGSIDQQRKDELASITLKRKLEVTDPPTKRSKK